MLINLPKIADHYFGVSFGHIEDAKLIHNVILLVTQMPNLAETFSQPRIQHLLGTRKFSYLGESNHEKTKLPK